jgi:multidrug resistance efflux pump
MKKQLQILTLMIRFLILATLLVAAAAALYLWSTWHSSPETDNIFIHTATPRATVVLQAEDGQNER